MKTIKRSLLLVILLISSIGVTVAQQIGPAPQFTLSYQDMGNGYFIFTLTPTNNTPYHLDPNGVHWGFDDGSYSPNTNSLSIGHQFTGQGSFSPSVGIYGWVGDQTSQTQYPFVRSAAVDVEVVQLPTGCPRVVFLPFETHCGSGEISMTLAECGNGFNGQLQHVTWDMGDGSAPIQTSGMFINYTYSHTDHYIVKATATYLMPNGSTCIVEALQSTQMVTNPQMTSSQICQSPNFFTIVNVPIIVMDGYLSLTPSGPIHAGTNYNVALNYTGGLGAMSSTISILVDGVVVCTTNSLPVSGSAICTTSFAVGQHVIECVIDNVRECSLSFSNIIDVVPSEPCADCFTFKPEYGKAYWVSAWVKEEHVAQVLNYSTASIQLEFVNSGSAPLTFFPSDEIIEGWQRIVGEFTIPNATTDLKIKLLNGGGAVVAYFDDIRIHPFNASLKSYVYDPVTFLLTAELDDNNYATFYEYDKEGQLIRIKKETARGIMTIQESRSSNPKN